MLAPKYNRLLLTPGGLHKKLIIKAVSIIIVTSLLLSIFLGEDGPLGRVRAPRGFNYREWGFGEGTEAPRRPAGGKTASGGGAMVPYGCRRYAGSKGRVLKHKLHELLDLLPEESRHEELMRPIRSAGRKDLRELGLRTRELKQYFEAWQALHVISEDGVDSIRDDIVQFIWCEYSQQHNGHASIPSVGDVINSYETFGDIIANMTQSLFPWATTTSRDAVTFRTHIQNGGQGIVITAGNAQAVYLFTSIQMIRRLGCELPIEVMYLGDADLSPENRAELEELPGVVTRDLKRLVHNGDQGWELSSFAAKPFALLFSSFREAVLVDADVLFFRSPEALLNDTDYIESGALFFHDRVLSIQGRHDSPLFGDQRATARYMKTWLEEAMPLPVSEKAKAGRLWTGQSIHVQESGVVVVDKWEHFFSLLVATWLNGPGLHGLEPGSAGFSNEFYGDKESYWIGWELAGDEFYEFHGGQTAIMGSLGTGPQNSSETHNNMYSSPRNPSGPVSTTIVGSEAGQRSTSVFQNNVTICAPQILHLDLEGAPLWMNGWILKDKYDEDNQQVIDFSDYMTEQTALTDPESWYLGEHNMACLTGHQTYNFTKAEKDMLDETAKTASRAGANIRIEAP